MNRVKAHPNRHLYLANEPACISVTPMRKGKHTYYMGTLLLNDVRFIVHASGHKRQMEGVREDKPDGDRNVHAWITGNVVHEAVEQDPPSDWIMRELQPVRYDYTTGRFRTLDGKDVTDNNYRAAYCVGRDFYISKD